MFVANDVMGKKIDYMLSSTLVVIPNTAYNFVVSHLNSVRTAFQIGNAIKEVRLLLRFLSLNPFPNSNDR